MTFEIHANTALQRRLWPDDATIEQVSTSQGDEGEVIESWSTRWSDIPAQFAPLGGSETVRDTEDRTAAGDYVKAGWQVILQGDYAVEESDRCVTRGMTYGITAVLRDSYAIATVLHLEELAPVEEESS